MLFVLILLLILALLHLAPVRHHHLALHQAVLLHLLVNVSLLQDVPIVFLDVPVVKFSLVHLLILTSAVLVLMVLLNAVHSLVVDYV